MAISLLRGRAARQPVENENGIAIGGTDEIVASCAPCGRPLQVYVVLKDKASWSDFKKGDRVKLRAGTKPIDHHFVHEDDRTVSCPYVGPEHLAFADGGKVVAEVAMPKTATLEDLKPGAVFINTARGGLVDESELKRLLGVTQQLTSQHLSQMRMRGVLACRREGTMAYYSIANPDVVKVIHCIRRG